MRSSYYEAPARRVQMIFQVRGVISGRHAHARAALTRTRTRTRTRAVTLTCQVKGAAKDGLVSFEAYKRSGEYHFDLLSVDIDDGELRALEDPDPHPGRRP